MVNHEKLAQYGLDAEKLPRHVAMIMDGNGRWAKKRLMPRTYGHKKGVERVKEIVKASSLFGIEAITLYAFSTENWKRPQEEVSVLMSLLAQYLKSEVEELHENGVRFRMIGDRSGLSATLQDLIEQAEVRTKDNTELILTVAINYGGRDELDQAAVRLAQDVAAGKCQPSAEEFRRRLYTVGLPPVDYLIRTSGELRVSNFLLYQAAYAELYFIDVYWPDFDTAQYARALQEFAARNRRYGGV
ncbi:MAG: isoprenyl transferase [Clostridiales bacterium]|nr:MAG: isoprenyl transferase [Clostridiales bacterium]